MSSTLTADCPNMLSDARPEVWMKIRDQETYPYQIAYRQGLTEETREEEDPYTLGHRKLYETERWNSALSQDPDQPDGWHRPAYCASDDWSLDCDPSHWVMNMNEALIGPNGPKHPDVVEKDLRSFKLYVEGPKALEEFLDTHENWHRYITDVELNFSDRNCPVNEWRTALEKLGSSALGIKRLTVLFLSKHHKTYKHDQHGPSWEPYALGKNRDLIAALGALPVSQFVKIFGFYGRDVPGTLQKSMHLEAFQELTVTENVPGYVLAIQDHGKLWDQLYLDREQETVGTSWAELLENYQNQAPAGT